MNITSKQIRERNLQYIIDKDFGGVRRKLAITLEIEATSVSRWFKSKTRGISDGSARIIEKKIGYDVGWLDNPHPELWGATGLSIVRQKMDIDETISQRILLRISQLGIRKADIARQLGLKPQNFSNWISRNSVPKDFLHALSDVLNVNVLWLQFGDDEPLSSSTSIPVKKVDGDIGLKENTIEIKQHKDVIGSMGNGAVLDQDQEIESWTVSKGWALNQIPNNTGLANLRIITGKGDSMKGMYNDGDPIIIDIGVITLDYDAVYFFRVGDRHFIKRLQSMPDGTVLAISKNTEYRDMVIKESDDLHIVGRVLKVWQGEVF